MTREICIDEAKDAHFTFIHDTIDSDIVIRLAREGARVFVDEIFFSDASLTSNLRIIHDAPRTFSRVDARGAVRAGVKNVANTTVVIPKQSVECDTHVSQRFLLLDKTAKAQAFPGLEIIPNRVKAGHASSVVPLSKDALFYLNTRGLSHEQAKHMIIEGFLNIPETYKKQVRVGV
ncbi:hypothetical protein COT72_00335 [archaeon CG10_big_fil_rev_8_21_14_0_10_43_11]|nr:MAG: hypothetical protein COT72_00335 [archaeon CG10_big_fil_rev_8_21_14_0_10_43_11]